MTDPTHRDLMMGQLRRLFERTDTRARTEAKGSPGQAKFAADAQTLKDAIHYLGADSVVERAKAIQRTADPTANALIEAMLPQLLIVFARRLGGTVRVPVDEVDATGGVNLALQLDGADFVFVVGRKA